MKTILNNNPSARWGRVVFPSGMIGLQSFVRLLHLALSLPLAALVGCATAPSSRPSEGPATDCRQFYQGLDDAVFAAGVRDAGAAAVPGYPFLRVNRFLASFRGELDDPVRYQQWVSALARLDLELRRLELANLPPRHLVALAEEGGPPVLRLERCSARLVREVYQDRGHRRRLQEVIEVPDNYLAWRRVVGLYPLARLLARATITDLHERLQRPFLLPPGELPLSGRLIRYRPLLSEGRATPLTTVSPRTEAPVSDVPLPAPTLLEQLFQRFAPIIEIDTLGETDRIGLVGWDTNGSAAVDTGHPAVYRYPSYTRFQGRTLLQLNYLFWFPARDTGDLYSGHLDALIWRVTLDTSARPLAYDSIHACGCYYQLFPLPGYRVVSLPAGEEPVLAPVSAPAWTSMQRLVLRLASGTHYLQAVYTDGSTRTSYVPYRLLEFRELLSMPLPAGGRRSLFRPDGLVAGSERPERYLLWPFGVLSPGAMRQPGTHAIAFIGRRHFDDPWLLQSLIRKEE
jgi:hypothetical protein